MACVVRKSARWCGGDVVRVGVNLASQRLFTICLGGLLVVVAAAPRRPGARTRFALLCGHATIHASCSQHRSFYRTTLGPPPTAGEDRVLVVTQHGYGTQKIKGTYGS